VVTNLRSTGWRNGDTPDTIADGYEYCLGANIAYRAGLEKVKVVNVPFEAIVAGRVKDFDLALAQISITEPRKKVVDFWVSRHQPRCTHPRKGPEGHSCRQRQDQGNADRGQGSDDNRRFYRQQDLASFPRLRAYSLSLFVITRRSGGRR
jgi:Bacterial extracellular solute-binding proteins, family 3